MNNKKGLRKDWINKHLASQMRLAEERGVSLNLRKLAREICQDYFKEVLIQFPNLDPSLLIPLTQLSFKEICIHLWVVKGDSTRCFEKLQKDIQLVLMNGLSKQGFFCFATDSIVDLDYIKYTFSQEDNSSLKS